MRLLRPVLAGALLGLGGLGVWFHVLPWPLEIAVRTGVFSRPSPREAPAPRLVRGPFGATQVVLEGVLEGGALVAGVAVHVRTPFGTRQGLEQVAVGTRTQYQRLGLLTGTQWAPGMPGVVVDADDTAVVLTALGGRFDGEGLVELRVLPLLPGVDAGR